VRALPWINYDDYVKLQFSMFLRSKKTKASIKSSAPQDKLEVVTISRNEIERVDAYVANKERNSHLALPATFVASSQEQNNVAEEFGRKLTQIRPGRDNA